MYRPWDIKFDAFDETPEKAGKVIPPFLAPSCIFCRKFESYLPKIHISKLEYLNLKFSTELNL